MPRLCSEGDPSISLSRMLMQTVEVQRIDPNHRLVPSIDTHVREAVEYSMTSTVYFLAVIERFT